jgi:hypothetical protein
MGVVIDMAQKVIEVVSVKKNDVDKAKVRADSTLTMRLKVYEDGVDPAKADPLIDVVKTKIIKGQVEGKDDAQLVNQEVVKIKAEFQAEIDRYIEEKRIQSTIDVKAVSDSLDVSKVSAKAVI